MAKVISTFIITTIIIFSCDSGTHSKDFFCPSLIMMFPDPQRNYLLASSVSVRLYFQWIFYVDSDFVLSLNDYGEKPHSLFWNRFFVFVLEEKRELVRWPLTCVSSSAPVLALFPTLLTDTRGG